MCVDKNWQCPWDNGWLQLQSNGDPMSACGRVLCVHEAANMGYGEEIPKAILAPHSSSPIKNLSLDAATGFANGSELIPVSQCHSSFYQ